MAAPDCFIIQDKLPFSNFVSFFLPTLYLVAFWMPEWPLRDHMYLSYKQGFRGVTALYNTLDLSL